MSCVLVLLVGLPGSGKTKLAKYLHRSYKRTFVVEYDKVITINSEYKTQRENISTLILSHLKTSQSNLIVLDDNFYYRSMRYKFYKLALDMNLSFCQIYFDIPLTKCLINNSSRPNPIPTEVILDMNSVLDVPNPNKYNWEKLTFLINEENCNNYHNEIERFIEFSRLNPVGDNFDKAKINETVKQNKQNSLHFSDLALRKLINVLIKSNNNYSVERLKREKLEILSKIKSGDLILPEVDDCSDTVECYFNFLKGHFMK